MEFVAIYMTAKNPKEAKRLGEILIKKRLAGCINIFPEIVSIYRWDGKIQRHGESVIIAKTRKSLVKKVIACVKKHHSYTVPCINALPVLEGNTDYLSWLEKETTDK